MVTGGSHILMEVWDNVHWTFIRFDLIDTLYIEVGVGLFVFSFICFGFLASSLQNLLHGIELT